jgi:hypothetical protein
VQGEAQLLAGAGILYGYIDHAVIGGLMFARMLGWLVIVVAILAVADSGHAQSPDSAWKANLSKEQVQQMEVVLQRGRTKALICLTTTPGAARGEGKVEVVFDGQKGRIVEATVGPPYTGTASESCIKRSFIGEIFVPFDGPPRKAMVAFGAPAR